MDERSLTFLLYFSVGLEWSDKHLGTPSLLSMVVRVRANAIDIH